MNILFIGDIVGRLGRLAVIKSLPGLIRKHRLDFVFANAENAAHGSGVTDNVLKELMSAGIDGFTAGDHAFRNHKQLGLFDDYPIIRPANLPHGAPGRGHLVAEKNHRQVMLISLIGQVFMNNPADNPFHKINQILADKSLRPDNVSAIIIDIHAEATSEKVNLGHHLDGRVSAVIGTHTHIMTADAAISPRGTAYITDVGMAGAVGESLGIGKKGALKQFLTGIKEPHVLPEKGEAAVNSVLIRVGRDARAREIRPITVRTSHS